MTSGGVAYGLLRRGEIVVIASMPCFVVTSSLAPDLFLVFFFGQPGCAFVASHEEGAHTF